MDTRDIVIKTITNMQLIYEDIGKVLQIIEEQMKNNGFKAMGDAAVIWEKSASLHSPESWLYRWFARAYLNDKYINKCVGYCVHLGGYEKNQIENFESLSLSLPLINISVLDFNKAIKDIARTQLLNSLWGSGWINESWIKRSKIIRKKIIKSEIDNGHFKGHGLTYFIDPFILTKKEIIEKDVSEPMIKMFNGEEDWVINSKIDALQIT